MAKENHLFQLIQSLNKQEKRFFKLSASIEHGEKQYLKLFDLLAKHKEYNEEEIALKLGMKKNRLAFQKNYLYNLILNRMAFFSPGTETELRKLLSQANFLYNKGLDSQYNKVLIKAKDVAVQLGATSSLLEIIEKEYRHVWKGGQGVQQVEKLLKEARETLTLLNNEKEYNLLNVEAQIKFAGIGSVRKRDEIHKLKKLFKNPLLAKESQALNFYSKQMRCNILCGYYAVKGNLAKRFSYAKKKMDLFIAHPKEIKYRSEHYLFSLHNIISVCMELKKYDEAKYYLDMLAQNRALLVSGKENAFAFFVLKNNSMDYYIKTGRFEEGLLYAEKMWQEMMPYEKKLGTLLNVFLLLNMAVIYFGAKKYNTSIVCLNKIRNEYTLRVRPDFESLAKIFYLVVHFEKGNYALLPNLSKSVHRHLLTKDRLYKFENIMLDFFGTIEPNVKSRQTVITEFNRVKKKIQALDPADKKVATETFDFISWFESKIESRSFAEIVQRKMHKA